MGLGRLLHHHPDTGAVINHPHAYEVMAHIGFLGRRREIFTRLALLAGVRPGHHVLDVGCGTGYLTRVLAPVVGPHGHVTGVDPSSNMIDYARRRSPANCTYLVGEGQSLDLPDASYDLVVSSLALHHIPADARAAAVREMHRVLRPGGHLLIAEHRPPANPIAARLSTLLSGPALRHDTRSAFTGMIRDAGFRIDDRGELPGMLYWIRATRP